MGHSERGSAHLLESPHSDNQTVVRCGRVEIVDGHGRIRIVLGVSGTAPERAEVAIYGPGGSLALVLGDGEQGNGFVGLSDGDPSGDGGIWISARSGARPPWEGDVGRDGLKRTPLLAAIRRAIRERVRGRGRRAGVARSRRRR